MDVVIYFKNGNTAYFKDVEDYKQNAENIYFTYGVSSQERKKATFYKDSIAGIART